MHKPDMAPFGYRPTFKETVGYSSEMTTMFHFCPCLKKTYLQKIKKLFQNPPRLQRHTTLDNLSLHGYLMHEVLG